MSMVPVADAPPPSVGTVPPPERYAVAPPPPETALPNGTTTLGVLLLLVADAMVLVALLAIWWTIKGGSPAWPPRGTSLGTYLPSMVTITAVMSAFSMQWALSSIRRNDQRSGGMALGLTLFLGLAVANAQWYSMLRPAFGIRTHAYGTLYYLLLTYHLVHVVVGLAAIVLLGARALAGHFGRFGYDPLRAAAVFWHYGVVAWFVIMTAMFLFSPVS
ncbi:MAG: cytochrome c oxidase subunit 3 [Actinomycetota bacterium]|nr:cytochrome c oxidase subunit 3 [Actinomycetota bacterium]